MNMNYIKPVFVVASLACLFTFSGFALNTSITPEMLTTLRAASTVNASNDPLLTTQIYEGKQDAPGDRSVTLDAAQFFLERAFDLLVSLETVKGHDSIDTNLRFQYGVQANERLVDALERLVKASNHRVQWRLIGGRIVLIEIPPEQDYVPIGDRIVPVDISADTLKDAFIQVERAYNAQYRDIPLGMYIRNYQTAHLRAQGNGRFTLQGEMVLRKIIVDLLNQLDSLTSYYMLTPRHVAVDKRYARKYYLTENLYYYGLSLQGFESQFKDFEDWALSLGMQEAERRYLWSFAQFPEMTKRLMQYFDRIYPELAAMEHEANEMRED